MWHISEGSEKLGPLTEEQVENHIRNGKLSTNALVWRSGMTQWSPASSVPEIYRLFQKHTPPPITHAQAHSVSKEHQNQQVQVMSSSLATNALVKKSTKNCPYCAEEILEQAIKCKHCNSMLNEIVRVENRQAAITHSQQNHIQAVQNISSSPATVDDIKKIMKPKKSGGLALILSLIVIGAGQLYNGDIGKGLTMFLLAIVLVPISAGILWFPIAIWSAIDAYSSATNPDERW